MFSKCSFFYEQTKGNFDIQNCVNNILDNFSYRTEKNKIIYTAFFYQ